MNLIITTNHLLNGKKHHTHLFGLCNQVWRKADAGKESVGKFFRLSALLKYFFFSQQVIQDVDANWIYRPLAFSDERFLFRVADCKNINLRLAIPPCTDILRQERQFPLTRQVCDMLPAGFFKGAGDKVVQVGNDTLFQNRISQTCSASSENGIFGIKNKTLS